MKVLVCGGRDYSDQKRLRAVLDGLDITSLVHGGSHGADTLAGHWAREKGIPVTVYEAEWGRYGKRAGPRRNQQMLDMERPDLVIAFPGGVGTLDMVKRARKAGLPIEHVLPRSDDTGNPSKGAGRGASERDTGVEHDT